MEALIAGLATALERERLADEAAQARVAAEVARSRSSFLAAVGHNLRTPLAATKAAVATLLCPHADLEPEDRQALLQTIHDETERLERLVSKVLAVSRIRSGGLEIEPEPVDLAGLAGAVAQRLRPLLADRRIRIGIPADLPAIKLDVVMMEQVLLNLLENALRYAPPGSDVLVCAREAEGDLELRVVDHGPGIPAEHRAHVFDEFYQAQPRQDGTGTGLGLAIVRGVIGAHGGRVWCEETPGGGATIVLRTPRGLP